MKTNKRKHFILTGKMKVKEDKTLTKEIKVYIFFKYLHDKAYSRTTFRLNFEARP